MTEPYTHTYLPPSPKERRERRGLPWWGALLIAIGTFVIGFFVGAIVVAVIDEVFDEGRPALIAAIDGEVGECFDGHVDPETHSVGDIGEKVGCEGQHSHEVYARFDLPVPTDGEPEEYVPDDMEALSDTVCLMAFSRYVGQDYEASDLDYTPVIPTQQAWQFGERTIHCLLHEWDGDAMTGSGKRANRSVRPFSVGSLKFSR